MDAALLVISSIGVAGALVGLWYTGRQLHDSRLSARGSFLLELDRALDRHADTHRKLRPGGEWAGTGRGPSTADEWIAVEDYMGLFERMEVLVEGGVLDSELVNRLHGYRIANIVANPIIRKTKLVDSAAGWTDFLSLLERLERVGRKMPSELGVTKP